MLSESSWASVFLPVPTPDGALYAPDACRAHMVQEVLDPSMRLNLSQTCKEGRRWVVHTAKNATLTLNLNGRPSQVQTRVQAAAVALQMRGHMPTTLVLQHARGRGMASAQQVVTELRSVLGHITQLCLDFPVPPSGTAALATLLSTIAAACPRLHTLQLTDLRTTLPFPPPLPQITQLKVSLRNCNYQDRQAIVDSCAPYMPQLTRAIIAPLPPEPESLQEAPSAISTATLLCPPLPALTTLTLDTELNDGFISLLLQHARAVTTLSVRGVWRISNQHAHCQWAIGALHVLGGDDAVSQSVGDLVQFLPLSFSGITALHTASWRNADVTTTFRVPCDVQDGGGDVFLQRLRHFSFNTLRRIILEPHPTIAQQPDTAPDALTHTLTALTPLLSQHPKTPIRMEQWQWTPKLSKALSTAALRLHHHPSIQIHTDIYQPDIADTLRPCAWWVTSLEGTGEGGCTFKVPQDVDRLSHLLDPRHNVPRGLRTLNTHNVVISLDKKPEASVLRRHRTLLSNLHLHCQDITVYGDFTGDRHADGEDEEACGAALLEASLQLLGAINIAVVNELELAHWTMTPGAVAALRQLSSWPEQALVFDWELKWVSEPGLYRSLALGLGSNFDRWVFRQDMRPELLKDVVQGVVWFRSRSAPLVIEVGDKEQAQIVKGEVQRLGADKWVTARRYRLEWEPTESEEEEEEEEWEDGSEGSENGSEHGGSGDEAGDME